ncbi:glycosyltransferase family 4 protein [Pseudomonas sp. TMW22091]|uniref:glycosyltransferase family 4 protein n=1 Tax=Pseudomonas sp. TMW22091 TaxID=2506435 RepID=UPI001F0FD5EB|nr:glycosyltransferase [Pseudomonas sp. TMW22091]MCH4873234.1 glycosyltransferase [Pseudomonas sp. TMW22091]
MKIVHVIVGLNVGGAELMLYRLCSALSSGSDDEHMVISLTSLGEVGSLLQARGITVVPLGMSGVTSALHGLIKLVRELKHAKPDIVQTWMYHADLLGGVAARLVGVRKIIWGIRTTDINKGGGKLTILVRKICSWLSASVPTVIICAAQASRKAHSAIGYASNRMIVVPNGFDMGALVASEQDRQALRMAYGVEHNELLIGSLGRFHQVKDHSTFIHAAGILAKKFTHVKFLLVGRDVDINNLQLMSNIKSTGYEERFILLGQRQDVAICLKAMDVFCLHSYTEGFPNVLGEAMSMGLPCVTTDVGDAAFLIGDNGLVVPPQAPVELSTALAHLIELSPEERREIGQGAYQRIVDNFTMKCAELRFKEIYDALNLNEDIR